MERATLREQPACGVEWYTTSSWSRKHMPIIICGRTWKGKKMRNKEFFPFNGTELRNASQMSCLKIPFSAFFLEAMKEKKKGKGKK